MANLSSKTGFTPVQTKVYFSALNAATTVQNFAVYQAQELTGFVYVTTSGTGAQTLRASVKVMVVQNGLGVWEVASADIAGDQASSGATAVPIVSFAMSGSSLQATLSSSITGTFSSAYIQYQLSAPALGGNFPLTVDSSSIAISDAAPLSYRNKLINGNFEIWQRGTAAVGAITYLADRWRSSGGTESYSQGTATPPTGSKYYAITTRTTATSNSCGVIQRIESANLRGLTGKTVTVSFYARQTSGTIIPAVARVDYANAVDDFSTATNIQNIVLSNFSASWQKFTASWVVSANEETNGIQLLIGGGASVTGPVTLNIAQVQLEVGSSATAFEQRPIGLELSLCQRYYDTNYPVGTAPGTALNFPGAIGIKDPSTTTEFENTCPFHVTMRAAPSVTLYRPGDGVINTVEEFGSGSKTVTSITANRITTSGFTSVVISGGSAGAKVYFYMYTASAEL